MTSRFAQAIPTHPPFIAVPEAQLSEADQSWLAEHFDLWRLAEETLRQAYLRTPWDRAITLRVRDKHQGALWIRAVNIIGGEPTGTRVVLTWSGDKQPGKNVLMGLGRLFKDTPPWGPPPPKEVLTGTPPAAVLDGV